MKQFSFKGQRTNKNELMKYTKIAKKRLRGTSTNNRGYATDNSKGMSGGLEAQHIQAVGHSVRTVLKLQPCPALTEIK
jgi:hypothetical protein